MSSSTQSHNKSSKAEIGFKQQTLSSAFKRKEPSSSSFETNLPIFGHPEHQLAKKPKLLDHSAHDT